MKKIIYANVWRIIKLIWLTMNAEANYYIAFNLNEPKE